MCFLVYRTVCHDIVVSENSFVSLVYVVVHLFLLFVLCIAQFVLLLACLGDAFLCCLYFLSHTGCLGQLPC